MSVVLKMYCTNVSDATPDPNDGVMVTMAAVTDSNDDQHDNQKFWQATPLANFYCHIRDREAAKEFIKGSYYYMKFELAPVPQAEAPQKEETLS